MSDTLIQSRPDWRLELQRAYTNPAELLAALDLDPEDFTADSRARQLFPLRVPRPFVQLMERGKRDDPLLLQVLPRTEEFDDVPGYTSDPLQEQQSDVVAEQANGLLHKYRSRVLLIVRGGCAINCRYCFRRHFPYQDVRFSQRELQQTLSYLNQHPDVNEVILSGGDPLMAGDRQLDELMTALESVDSLTRIRIHSRLPVVIPSRLTVGLRERLATSRLQASLVIHANHPNEISDALASQLTPFRQSGIHLFNQSVLLRDINDSADTLVELSERLFSADVLPYYLHLLDKVSGAAHFDISTEKAQSLWRTINESLPGFLVPKLVQEIAGEASKTPIMPIGPSSQ